MDGNIRTDLWSFGISLVKIAVSNSPIHNCLTDLKLLAGDINNDPSLLLQEGFSKELCLFIREW